MEKKTEIRMLAQNLAVRSENDDKMIVEGYAVVFDSPATHGFTEIVDRNAFNGCDMKSVPLKYNHDDSHLIIASTKNNSMSLTVDDIGLKIRAELIDTTSNIDIYKSIRAGLLDKMSFAFTVSEEDWDYSTDTRRILRIDRLYDVSVVDMPFYDTTSIYARALDTLNKGKNILSSNVELKKRKLALKVRLMKGEKI